MVCLVVVVCPRGSSVVLKCDHVRLKRLCTAAMCLSMCLLEVSTSSLLHFALAQARSTASRQLYVPLTSSWPSWMLSRYDSTSGDCSTCSPSHSQFLVAGLFNRCTKTSFGKLSISASSTLSIAKRRFRRSRNNRRKAELGVQW